MNRSVGAIPTTLKGMKEAIAVLRKERKEMVRHLILFLYECTSIL